VRGHNDELRRIRRRDQHRDISKTIVRVTISERDNREESLTTAHRVIFQSYSWIGDDDPLPGQLLSEVIRKRGNREWNGLPLMCGGPDKERGRK